MAKVNVAVLFGGNSFEHEVSLNSAYNVIKNLDRDEFQVFPIGITKNGEWFFYSGDIEKIKTKEWEKEDNDSVLINFNSKGSGILRCRKDSSLEPVEIDCIFPVLHGQNGEDGRIQSVLELLNIPYVGCDSLSSALCMNKVLTHLVLDSNGIKGTKWESLKKVDVKDLDATVKNIGNKLSFPIFTKPASCGSSVGIKKCVDLESLKEGILFAFKYEDEVICEANINGKEVECAVLGDEENIKTSVVGQIKSYGEFYDYDSKYKEDSKLIIPAEIEEEVSLKIRETAKKAFKTMRCYGLSRIDFFVTENNEIYLNEINTLPGFTNISMYTKLFEKSGILYKDLLKEIIGLALKRKKF